MLIEDSMHRLNEVMIEGITKNIAYMEKELRSNKRGIVLINILIIWIIFWIIRDIKFEDYINASIQGFLLGLNVYFIQRAYKRIALYKHMIADSKEMLADLLKKRP